MPNKIILWKLIILLTVSLSLFDPLSIVAQSDHSSQIIGKNNFDSIKLNKGLPQPLEKMKYFSSQHNLYNALIQNDESDSIYFISEKSENDSNNFLLLWTSNGKVEDFNYLNFDNTDGNRLHGYGNLNQLNKSNINVELYYSEEDHILQYRFFKKDRAKNGLELGIRDELILIVSNQYNSQNRKFENTLQLLLPFNFHLTAGIRFLKFYKIDFRFGVMAAEDYIYGFDEGLYFQAGIPSSNFYGVIGVDFFNNNLAGGNTETGGTFTFYCFGLGYEASKNFSLDMMYGFPGNNKVYAKEPAEDYGGTPGLFYDMKINGIFRLGFQYSFIF